MADLSDPVAVLRIPLFRRGFVVAVQGFLGLLLLYVAVGPAALPVIGRAIFAVLGAVVLWQAGLVWRSTARDVILTRDGLFDSTGAAIAALEDIQSVDRSIFALKPSNGFVIRLSQPAGRAWVPGVWWRVGTRVGIGGTASARSARELADLTRLLKDGHLDL